MLEKTPKNSLRVPFLNAVFPRGAVRLPVPRPAREPEQHDHRLGVGALRHLSRPAGLGGPAMVAGPDPRVAKAGRRVAGRDRRRPVAEGDRRRCSPTSSGCRRSACTRSTTRRWSRTRERELAAIGEFAGLELDAAVRRRCRSPATPSTHPPRTSGGATRSSSRRCWRRSSPPPSAGATCSSVRPRRPPPPIRRVPRRAPPRPTARRFAASAPRAFPRLLDQLHELAADQHLPDRQR